MKEKRQIVGHQTTMVARDVFALEMAKAATQQYTAAKFQQDSSEAKLRQKQAQFFMDVTHMVTAVAITWTLLTCRYKPFGRPFKVTDKRGDRSRTIVRWDMLRVFGAIMGVSLAAIAWALTGPDATVESSPVDLLNLVWAGISALLSGIACLVCFEKPRLHREELFRHDHPGRLGIGDLDLDCTVDRLTTVDASLRLARRQRRLKIGTAVDLAVDGVARVRGTVTRRRGRRVVMGFSLPEAERRAMVVSLYGQPNDNLPLQADLRGALGGLWRRSIGRD